jgi:hypothetical protein
MTTLQAVRDVEDRLDAARQSCDNFGQRLFVTSYDRPLFKKLVWTSNYRSQVLHHLSVTGTSHLLFAVSSTSGIIYAVIVEVTAECRRLFSSTILKKCAEHLQYFSGTDILARLDLLPEEFGHAIYLHTVQFWRKLQQALENYRRTKGKPAPPANDLAPFVIAH